LDANILEEHAASISSVEVHGEWKVDIDIGFMDKKSWTTSLTTSTANIPTSNSPWRLSQMATFPSWILIYTKDQIVPWVTLYRGSSPTLTSL
jgi:hypothetical protein